MKTIEVPEQLLRDILDNVELVSMMDGSSDTLDEQAERMRRLIGTADEPTFEEAVRPKAEIVELFGSTAHAKATAAADWLTPTELAETWEA